MSADGTFLPCCFLNGAHIRVKLQQWLEERGGTMEDFMYTGDQSIVKERKSWQLIMEALDDYSDAFSECRNMCGSPDLVSNDGGAMHKIVLS